MLPKQLGSHLLLASSLILSAWHWEFEAHLKESVPWQLASRVYQGSGVLCDLRGAFPF